MVQAFPGPGSQTQVSAGGGTNPVWSADSRTLYYLGDREPDSLAGAVFAVDIGASSVAIPGKPRQLFRYADFEGCTPLRCYDVSPDGRFLMPDISATPRASVTRMDLVLNWTAALPRRR